MQSKQYRTKQPDSWRKAGKITGASKAGDIQTLSVDYDLAILKRLPPWTGSVWCW
jgi:hypothetical protein